MTVDRTVSIFAGFMIKASQAAAHFTGQIKMSQMSCLRLTALVDANLFQMGFTGFFPAATLMRMLRLKDKNGAACCP